MNLGPGVLILPDNSLDMSGQDFHYNPRCLKRDFTDYALQRFANDNSVHDLMLQPGVWGFETLLQDLAGGPELGAHGGGHYAMGGDPGRDVYTSPGEPLFWSHHAMVDMADAGPGDARGQCVVSSAGAVDHGWGGEWDGDRSAECRVREGGC